MNRSQKKELNRSLNVLAKGSVVVLFGLIISKVLTYVYRIAIARVYGPEVYGLFALSLMIIGLFAVFSGLGLRQGLLRFVPIARGKGEDYKIRLLVNKSFQIVLFSGIVSAILLFFLSELIAAEIFNEPGLALFLKVFAIAIPAITVTEISLATVKAYERIGIFTFVANIFDNFLKLLLFFLFVFIGLKQEAVPFSYVAGAIVTIVVSIVLYQLKIKPFIGKKGTISRKERKNVVDSFFSYSWPLVFFGIVSSIFYWTDSFLLGVFRTVEEVGFYNAAVPIALLITLSKELFSHLFLPVTAKEYGMGNNEVVRELGKQIGKWIFMASLPIVILFLIFPEVFIGLLFGEEYLVAQNALRFLAIGALFLSVFEVSKDLLSIKGKSKTILVDIVIASALNLILNILLIPEYGINGAGFATMVSMVFLNILFVIQAKSTLGVIPVRRKMINVFFAGMIPGIIVVLLKMVFSSTLVTAAIFSISFLLLYVALILTTKCLDENDNEIYQKIKNHIPLVSGRK